MESLSVYQYSLTLVSQKSRSQSNILGFKGKIKYDLCSNLLLIWLQKVLEQRDECDQAP